MLKRILLRVVILMATKIRLQRTGAKKEPRYRVVAINSSSGSGAGYIEKIGNYFPDTEDENEEYDIDRDKAKKWLGNGAKPSSTVKNIFSEVGILEEIEEETATAQ